MLRVGRLRFYFFSREEPRMHVHVESPTGETKFWLDPTIGLVENTASSNATCERR